MIEVQELTKTYDNGVTTVDHISFVIESGETLMLIGTSGCGKTTTLKMINRLIEPTSGTILVDGKNVLEQHPDQLRRHMGFVIQNIGLLPHYTIAENIAIVPNLLKWEQDKIQGRTKELIELVGLSLDFLERFPHELSGGQQQRVGIARALAANPAIILFDEPFGALDPITRKQIQHEFKNLEALLKKTMVLVTHDVFEAFELGDQICLMDKGIIQQIGTPKELLFKPKNEFVQQFFQASRFELELKVLRLKDIASKLASQSPQAEKVLSFDEEMDILEVLQTIEKESPNQTTIHILDQKKKAYLETNAEDILKAFYQAKANF